MADRFGRVFGAARPVIATAHPGALSGAPRYDSEAGLDWLVAGAGPTSQWVGPKTRSRRRNRREVFAAAPHVLTSTSYLGMRPTGEIVIDHYASASFRLLCDLDRKDWAADIACAAGRGHERRARPRAVGLGCRTRCG